MVYPASPLDDFIGNFSDLETDNKTREEERREYYSAEI